MQKISLTLLTSLVVMLLLTGLVLPAGAQGLVPCGTSTTPPCTLCHVFTLAQNIINFMTTGIALPLAAVMIAIGGITLAVSAGSPERQGQGKKILTAAVVGLVIVMISWMVINTVINFIGGAQPTGFPWPWNEVQCK